jgi:hypothetical protein
MPTQLSAAPRAELPVIHPVDHRPPAITWRVEGVPKGGYPAAFGSIGGAVTVSLDLASI